MIPSEWDWIDAVGRQAESLWWGVARVLAAIAVGALALFLLLPYLIR